MTVRLVHLGIAQLPQLLLQLLHQHFLPAAELDVDHVVELGDRVGGVLQLLQVVSDRLGISAVQELSQRLSDASPRSF